MFLKSLKHDDSDDLGYRGLLIKVFIDRIYLYDDHFRILLNYSGRKGKSSNKAAREIERYFDEKSSDKPPCSPPKVPYSNFCK